MDLSSVVCTLKNLSFDQVIIRVREYPIVCGDKIRRTPVPTGTLLEDMTQYKPAIEVQAIACHPRTCGWMDGWDGIVWVCYTDPPPPPRPDYKKPLPLRSVVWAGTEEVTMAWNAICHSWADCPNWISQKPVVFCRQHRPDEGYTDIPVTDVLFLRLLDHLIGKIKSHEAFTKRRMSSIAEATPSDQRGNVYKAWLDVSMKKGWLLGALDGRFKTFVDSQYDVLASSLGIAPVRPFELPKMKK